MHLRLHKIRSVRRLSRRASIRRFRRNERGIQLVELAIVMPIFVLLFAATAEFGRYFYEYTTLAKGARIGARYLVNAKLSSFEDDNAKNLIVYGNTAGTGSPILPGLTTGQITIVKRNALGAPQTVGVPQTVTVEITGFEHQPLFDLGALLKNPDFSMKINVKPSITMRYMLNTPLG
jgi:Flp pilus assembly protein TadG